MQVYLHDPKFLLNPLPVLHNESGYLVLEIPEPTYLQNFDSKWVHSIPCTKVQN